jgi:hypothetical protein
LYLRKWLKRKAREMIKSKKEDQYTKVKEDLVLPEQLVRANIHYIKYGNYTELKYVRASKQTRTYTK